MLSLQPCHSHLANSLKWNKHMHLSYILYMYVCHLIYVQESRMLVQA